MIVTLLESLTLACVMVEVNVTVKLMWCQTLATNVKMVIGTSLKLTQMDAKVN